MERRVDENGRRAERKREREKREKLCLTFIIRLFGGE
jgi:hypothetical protein